MTTGVPADADRQMTKYGTTHDEQNALLFGSSEVGEGDAVVHIEHGLARFRGRSQIEVEGVEQDLISLEYRDGGKLMLPASEMANVWPYGASADSLTLDRLDCDDWAHRRDALVMELREAADELVQIDRDRRARPAPAVAASAAISSKIEKGFAHDLTPDQVTAVRDTFDDMRRTRPMDRVLIGDVGYGKTEVAIRAVAAAALCGYQALVAVPTTVLARQHYETFCERLSAMGLSVGEISRLKTAGEIDAVRAALAKGKCDVVIGTHALTSSDLSFQRLALVVIDEEQKFGADHKHALHHMGRGAHVLTMTATPIPRTLATAQVGLCDVSIVATAPKQRLPVETRVAANDGRSLIRAIETEVERNGQCYVVCPRIAGVEEVRAYLDGADTAFSLETAHGRLPKDAIEQAMLRFMSGDIDVLLSTSIIESGLDNGRANTMVVWNAERFGLSQLHQLRGRIGRSNVPAHMLLMTRTNLKGDSAAARRLKTFAETNELGAGFTIARLDRDMRGYGSVIGEEQSGHVSQLGIGLYHHLLSNELNACTKRVDSSGDAGNNDA